MTFWDFCAPFYDFAEKTKSSVVYRKMINTVKENVPHGSSVLEIAGGTGEMAIAVSDIAKEILCTDISDKMQKVTKKKVLKNNIKNIRFKTMNLYEIENLNESFDIIIASQVINIVDDPKKAAQLLLGAANKTVILTIALRRDLRGFAKFLIKTFRFLGFSGQTEYTFEEYEKFLHDIGFENSETILIEGEIPMCVAFCRK